MYAKLILVIFLCTITSNLLSKETRVAVNLAAGVALAEEQKQTVSYLTNLSLNVQKSKFLFTVRSTRVNEVLFLSEYDERMSDYAMLFGYRRNVSFGHLDFSAGFSVLNGVSRGALISKNAPFFGFDNEYEMNKYTQYGVALDFTLTDYSFFNKGDRKLIGSGVSLIANINSQNSYIGLAYTLTFGFNFD